MHLPSYCPSLARHHRRYESLRPERTWNKYSSRRSTRSTTSVCSLRRGETGRIHASSSSPFPLRDPERNGRCWHVQGCLTSGGQTLRYSGRYEMHVDVVLPCSSR